MSPASLEHGILQVGLERVSPAVADFRMARGEISKATTQGAVNQGDACWFTAN